MPGLFLPDRRSMGTLSSETTLGFFFGLVISAYSQVSLDRSDTWNRGFEFDTIGHWKEINLLFRRIK